MSVTIEKIMVLPSLRHAAVLAGKKSLNRIVTSISVLEYAEPTKTQDDFYRHIEFLGGELVITSFSSIADNVEAQCVNVRKLASAGEIGMILYYVGILIPEVDKRLIELCESLDFVLICMPENEPGLRYSEVICEVMDAVVRDRMDNTTFALDLVDQISRLPGHQRTVDSMLRLVSDQLRASAVITDAKGNVLSATAWPRNQNPQWELWIKELPALSGICPWELPGVTGERSIWIYHEGIRSEIDKNMTLLVFSEGRKIEAGLWKQAAEGVRLCMNLWGKKHDRIELLELVRAIIQDEPIKMRRLADIYRINVEELSDMWTLHHLGTSDLSKWADAVRELSNQYARISICESYEKDILIFPVGARTLHEKEEWTEALVRFCGENDISACLIRCTGLKSTGAVKDAYLTSKAYLADARKIFPDKKTFIMQEIKFAKNCRKITEEGEAKVSLYASILLQAAYGHERKEVLQTLAVYLLDTDSSVTDTAQKLFVHKNTVKYRLQRASDSLGFRIGDLPGSQDLMTALALRRLLHT